VRPAVFLDRDGTMIEDVGYLRRVDEVAWYPWTIDAIRLLNRAGFAVCVATNQGGIALELFPESMVADVHAAMTRDLDAAGARIDGWYYCPHHPDGRIEALRVECECRKPRPGMARQAARALDLDLARSFVIGDKVSDVHLAQAIGAQGVLVRTGHGEVELAKRGGAVPEAAWVAADLMDATAWVLQRAGAPGGAA
jgi:D-glycero-D-manno-heptose 1,7-bisphosphate phosphatase